MRHQSVSQAGRKAGRQGRQAGRQAGHKNFLEGFGISLKTFLGLPSYHEGKLRLVSG